MPVYRARDLLLVPSLLSAARIPLAAMFPFVADRTELALAVLGAAAVSDVLDGWIARGLGQATPLGALVDGITDKIFAASLLGTLIATGMMSPVLAVLLATREIGELPLAVRLLSNRRARRLELDRRANAFGKIATACEFASVVAALLRAPHLGVWVGVTAAVGAAAAWSYWTREIRAARASSARIYAR